MRFVQLRNDAGRRLQLSLRAWPWTARGNVYVADYGNNAVKEMPAGCASSSCVTTLGGGFNYPQGVAVDGAATSMSPISATMR